MTLQDKSLPHQIQLVFTDKKKRCLNGEVAERMAVVVTCNCYRIGTSDNFMAHIAPAPTPEAAFAAYDNVKYHKDKKTFLTRLSDAAKTLVAEHTPPVKEDRV